MIGLFSALVLTILVLRLVFKDKCQPNDTDLLDKQVTALPAEFTSRFGEICWAQGGVGYGWWPCCIYDPRLTVGSARAEARRHLGKRHLLYFFQCIDLPFSVLPETKILPWVEGLAENYHLGRAAKNYSRARYQLFQRALQAAIIELDKPRSKRLDFSGSSNSDYPQQQQLLPSPIAVSATAAAAVAPNRTSSSKQQRQVKEETAGKNVRRQLVPPTPPNRKKKQGSIQKVKRSLAKQTDVWTLVHQKEEDHRASSSSSLSFPSSNQIHSKAEKKRAAVDDSPGLPKRRSKRKPKPLQGDFPFVSVSSDVELWSTPPSNEKSSSSTPRSLRIAERRNSASKTEPGAEAFIGKTTPPSPHEDDELYCTIFEYLAGSQPNHAGSESSVGFVVLPSKQTSTFADLREAVTREIDSLGSSSSSCDWKFYIPPLGPVSQKQESKFGAVAPFIAKGNFDQEIGDGSSHNPLRLHIVKTNKS